MFSVAVECSSQGSGPSTAVAFSGSRPTLATWPGSEPDCVSSSSQSFDTEGSFPPRDLHSCHIDAARLGARTGRRRVCDVGPRGLRRGTRRRCARRSGAVVARTRGRGPVRGVGVVRALLLLAPVLRAVVVLCGAFVVRRGGRGGFARKKKNFLAVVHHNTLNFFPAGYLLGSRVSCTKQQRSLLGSGARRGTSPARTRPRGRTRPRRREEVGTAAAADGTTG